MRPTRRGLAVVAIVIVSLLLAAGFGSRALNAVVAPLFVAVLAGVISTARASPPTVTREPIENGTVGERRTVSVSIDVDRPVSATLEDALGDGLAATETAVETTLTGGTYSYEIDLEERGVHEVGPLTVTVTDVLGLVRRRFEDDRTVEVLVRPRPYELDGSREDVQSLVATTETDDRREFAHLREYRPGDSMRDVHWKATAKRADAEPIVTEYDRGPGRGSVDLAVESDRDGEDEAARAAASVATYVRERGRAVTVAVPEQPTRTERPLDALATLEAGELTTAERERADVLIATDEAGTTVAVDGREIPFDRLRDGRTGDRSGRTDPGEVIG